MPLKYLAQIDSLAMGRDSSLIEKFESIGLLEFAEKPDTIRWYRKHFQVYQPVYAVLLFPTHLGNLGSPFWQARLQQQQEWGFHWGFRSLEAFQYRHTHLAIYDCRTPYTALQYNLGARAEQLFTLEHYQNAGKNMRFGGKFRKINSLGDYNRQAADYTNAQVYAAFKKQRYEGLITAYFNNQLFQESGGLTDNGLILFANNTETNRKVYPVQLLRARTLHFANGLAIKQAFDLWQKTDTSGKVLAQIKAIGLYNHEFDRYTFEDEFPTPNYYLFISDPSRSAVNYAQSMHQAHAGMQAFWQRDPFTHAKVELKYIQEWRNLKSNFSLPNFIWGGMFQNRIFASQAHFKHKQHAIQLDYKQVLEGFNSGDYLFDVGYQHEQGQSVWTIKGGSRQRTADFIQISLLGNHIIRQGPKFNLQMQFFEAAWQHTPMGLKLSGRAFEAVGWVYINESGTAVQAAESIRGLELPVSLSFGSQAWKFETHALGQWSSNKEWAPVPQWMAWQHLRWEKRINQGTRSQLGMDIRYLSAGFFPGYRPEWMGFFNQNTIKTNALVLVEPFVNFQIKRAWLMLKLEHANAGLGGYNYLAIKRYPLADRALRFGVRWLFFD